MRKDEVINHTKRERSNWNHMIAQIEDGLMLKPRAEGEWSVKDILAHVMWYEREMVQMFTSRDFLSGSDLWNIPGVDERNAAVYHEVKDMSLADVCSESASVFTRLVHQLEVLPEEAYEDASYFYNMPPELKPWEIIAGNTFRHYSDHMNDIQTLLGH